ncbi:RHS repeat-associated core domain-containing protein [Pseudomonas kurunegalensis]|uniref:RHS repeat-associated core domain-containing protein n=1 Tax=Pseudomonas kurunegalensis TaxID=485880 RepID=UPI003D9A9984
MSTPLQYTIYGHDGCYQYASMLRFNGQRKESATGHYLLGNGYRAFNTVLMRFHSPDSLSPMGAGGLNCYAYCGGDPVNNTDPSGHEIVSKVKLPSIRLKVGSTKGGYSVNPDFNRGKFAPRVVSQRVVDAVDALGRGYGSHIEPIMNAAVWSPSQKLLVEGSAVTLSDRIGKAWERITSTPATKSFERRWLESEQAQRIEAFNMLEELDRKMKAAEDIPRVQSWLHDPKRQVPKVRDPGKTG